MDERDTISFAGFMGSRATALYREALVLTGSQRQAERLLEEVLIRTGLAWREALLTDPESHARAVMAHLAPAARSTLDDPEEIAALAEAPTTHAPHDITGRVTRGIAIRKRRNRSRGLAIAAGLALVVLAAYGVSALRGGETAPGADGARGGETAPGAGGTRGGETAPGAGGARGGETAPGAGGTHGGETAPGIGGAAGAGLPQGGRPGQKPAPGPIAPAAPASLDRVIDRGRATRLPMRLADGLYFRAEALGPNGILLGVTGLDYDPYRASDGLVWALGPGSARRVSLTRPPPRMPWAHVVGVSVAAWAEDIGDRFELFCADPTAESPVARQVSRTGVATAVSPIHASGDVVVWVDESSAVHWVRGCGGMPRSVGVPNVLGLSYPEVFYAERGRVRAFNLESGLSSEVGVLPEAPDQTRLAFAGNSTHVAWAIDGELFLLDRRGGALDRVPLRSIPPVGLRGRLTIGSRLVAYSQRLYESDVEYGFVYDVVSGTGTVLPTEAFASRDVLLWREDTSYVVATVLPA